MRQVLSETGQSRAIAFDQIDKAPEEKARGITIATAHGVLLLLACSVCAHAAESEHPHAESEHPHVCVCVCVCVCVS